RAERHHDPTQVDEVEADDEQVVDGVGEAGLAIEGIDQEGAAVFVEGPRYPNCYRHREHAVAKIRVEDVHGLVSFPGVARSRTRPELNVFKSRMRPYSRPVKEIVEHVQITDWEGTLKNRAQTGQITSIDAVS